MEAKCKNARVFRSQCTPKNTRGSKLTCSPGVGLGHYTPQINITGWPAHDGRTSWSCYPSHYLLPLTTSSLFASLPRSQWWCESKIDQFVQGNLLQKAYFQCSVYPLLYLLFLTLGNVGQVKVLGKLATSVLQSCSFEFTAGKVRTNLVTTCSEKRLLSATLDKWNVKQNTSHES